MPQYLSPGVYVEEVDSGSKPIEGVGTALAAFIGFAPQGPVNESVLIPNWTEYTKQFGSFMPGGYLAHSVYGYFNNGGGACYVIRIGQDGSANGSAPAPLTKSPAKTVLNGVELTALEAGEAGNTIIVDITDPTGGEGIAPDSAFNIVVQGAGKPEKFENIKSGKQPADTAKAIETALKTSKVVQAKIAETSQALIRPTNASARLAGGATSTALVPLETRVGKVGVNEMVGDAAERSGLGGLEALDNVTMVCAPDLMSAYQSGLINLEGVKTVQTAILNHCEKMHDRMAILDSPPIADPKTGKVTFNPQGIREWRMKTANFDSKFGTLYYPWIKVFDPATKNNILVPPCGHMAGIWARSDSERRVHKAPANEIVRGAIDLEFQVTKQEQDTLNPDGVNCIRSFPGRGIRVWGARTLSSDPSWRYVNVRRLFNYIEASINRGTQWVVFEPNDQDLWERVKRTIVAFMTNVWRDGALFGTTPSQAFYVKCDEELNPAEVRDVGQLIVEIGLAPVKPAEFVIFRLSQWTAGGGVSE